MNSDETQRGRRVSSVWDMASRANNPSLTELTDEEVDGCLPTPFFNLSRRASRSFARAVIYAFCRKNNLKAPV